MSSSLQRRQAVWGYLFLIIPLLYFVVIYVYPMVEAFRFSFLNYRTLSTETPFIGLRNYKTLFTLDDFWKGIWNTLRYAVVRAPAVLVVSLITALTLQRIIVGREPLRTVLMLPFVTSEVALAWLFRFIYFKNGPVGLALAALGVKQPQLLLNPATALYAISAVAVWAAIGYYALLFTVGLNSIPDQLYDAAKVDGASGWQVFRRITLPLLNPTIVLLSVVAVTASLKNFAMVRNMTDGGPIGSTLTLPLLIYRTAFYHLKMGVAAGMTVVFFLMILVITYIQLRVMQRHVEY
jgi:multiple sugar transport system permease protein